MNLIGKPKETQGHKAIGTKVFLTMSASCQRVHYTFCFKLSMKLLGLF